MREHEKKVARRPGGSAAGGNVGAGARPGEGPPGVPGEQSRSRVAEPRGAAGEEAGELKETAKSVAEEAKEEAKSRAREVRDTAEGRADRFTSTVGRQTGSLARALHAAADSLRSEGEGSMADLAGQAAEQVERMSGYLEEENPSAMMDDLEDLGRSNPGAFLGSAFTAGLVAGRFLKASRPDGNGRGDGRRAAVPPAGEAASPRAGAPTTTPGHTATKRSDQGGVP